MTDRDMDIKNLKVKIKINGEVHEVKRNADAVKSLKSFDEYSSPVLHVLGVPFGGPEMGRDSDGQAFHEDTDIWMKVGDSIPVTYYHGFGPDDPMEWQDTPAIIGRAVYAGKDERGHWFDTRLDEAEDLALRVLGAAPDGVKASSGAVSHLVRVKSSGVIDVWPVGELALFDTNEWRQPANQLAVVELKTKLETEPEALVKAAEAVKTDAVLAESEETQTLGEPEMGTETEKTTQEPEVKAAPAPAPAVEIDYDKITKSILPTLTETIEAKFNALDEKIVTPIGAPAVKRITELGFKGDQKAAFLHWIKTGDEVAVKAALQEGAPTEGGYLVPDDFYPGIIAKRDELSIARATGAMVIQTSLDTVNIPTENAMSAFTITAEEGAYSESEPTFGQVAITVYKPTMLIKVSEELMADDKANLDGFLTGMIGRAAAAWENDMFLTGTGTSEPQGVFVGGTSVLTTDYATTLGASEIPELYFLHPEPYMEGSVWIMKNATFGHIVGLRATSSAGDFLFMGNPAGSLNYNLMGKPVYISDQVATMASGSKSFGLFNMRYYCIAERQGMRIQRNPYLYQANGQIGLFVSMRVGGACLQAEALSYATQHS